jgi:hypothetical protein
MKKIYLSIAFIGVAWTIAFGQETTNYGTGSGTLGSRNSFFGFNSGKFSQSQTYSNSFFGHSSGMNNTEGDNNSAFGYESMLSNSTGYGNTAIGFRSLYSNTTGYANTSIGQRSMYSNVNGLGNVAVGHYALSENTSGYVNTAIGNAALGSNTIASWNTAVGNGALWKNSVGDHNCALGSNALYLNTTGARNTASGSRALFENVTGHNNTATGYQALYLNESGSFNSSYGAEALNSNTTGHRNVASGFRALYTNSTGYYNTASGSEAMYSNNDGKFNVAQGYYAMYANTSGNHNTGSGFRALSNNVSGGSNTAQGSFALYNITTGNNNSALGVNAGPSTGDLSNTTAIGYQAIPTASNQVRIGNTSVSSIGGQVSWSTFSDGRFKKDIKENVAGLEFINQLRPVSYVIEKSEVNKFLQVRDTTHQELSKLTMNRQTGFLAQEVEALVNKGAYDFNGVDAPQNESDHYSIRYAEFVVPLVKAVQELAGIVRQQEQRLLEQEEKLGRLAKQPTFLTGTAALAPLLFQNNPNPFHSDTKIEMSVPDNVKAANLIVYNLEGKQIKSFDINNRGEVSLIIMANELPAGMYLYTLIADGLVVDTKRMILSD